MYLYLFAYDIHTLMISNMIYCIDVRVSHFESINQLLPFGQLCLSYLKDKTDYLRIQSSSGVIYRIPNHIKVSTAINVINLATLKPWNKKSSHYTQLGGLTHCLLAWVGWCVLQRLYSQGEGRVTKEGWLDREAYAFFFFSRLALSLFLAFQSFGTLL